MTTTPKTEEKQATAPVQAPIKTALKPAVKPVKTTSTKAPAVKKPVAAKPATVKAMSKKVATPAKPVKQIKVEKHKKPKLVRDSFTIPKDEYELLSALKARAVNLKQPAKKSEVLRAGIKLLASLKDAEFLAALSGVPSLKTGRPASDKTA